MTSSTSREAAEHSEAVTERGVAFYDGARSFADAWPELRRRLESVIDQGKFSHGATVEALEQAVEIFTGADHAVGVGNGTDALIILLRALGIGPGDEVIVPCFTFVASASSVLHARGTPVFADVDPLTYTLDPGSARSVVSPLTKAIMPVHLFNQMTDMTAIRQVAEEANALVIEDSAEAIGMWYGGVHAGLLGAGGVLSFFPTKTLAALGDAGMIVTDDPAVADECRILRHHGRLGTTIAHMAGISNISGISGMNSKMDDIQAAIVLSRLERLNRDIAKRATLAFLYDEQLAEVDGVRTPVIARRPTATNPVHYVYAIEAEDKDGLVGHLQRRSIATEEYYPTPLHLQPCFSALGYAPGDFPNAERAARRTVALPLYPDLVPATVAHVCQTIREFYGQ